MSLDNRNDVNSTSGEDNGQLTNDYQLESFEGYKLFVGQVTIIFHN
jgi:hypothetical protein